MESGEKKMVVQESKAIQESSPAALIQQAVAGGADLEKLQGLLDLQIKWEGNEAKKAYVVAMTEFKADPPSIVKDKTVSYGQGKASYKHASLANVTEQINKALSKHGLSASWQTAQNGAIAVTCKITHVMGHSEETTLHGDPDASGSKNSIQAIGSTITYLQRYSLLCITGLAAVDEDDDGQSSESVEKIDDAQLNALTDMIVSLEEKDKTLRPRILGHYKVEALADLPKVRFKEVVTALDDVAKQQSKTKTEVVDVNE